MGSGPSPQIPSTSPSIKALALPLTACLPVLVADVTRCLLAISLRGVARNSCPWRRGECETYRIFFTVTTDSRTKPRHPEVFTSDLWQSRGPIQSWLDPWLRPWFRHYISTLRHAPTAISATQLLSIFVAGPILGDTPHFSRGQNLAFSIRRKLAVEVTRPGAEPAVQSYLPDGAHKVHYRYV